MSHRQKFKGDDAQSKEEKLIVEYEKNLYDCSKVHINLNKASCTDHEIFISLRDGCLAFAGTQIHGLVRMLSDTPGKIFFLKECQDIFNNYIDQASEDIK